MAATFPITLKCDFPRCGRSLVIEVTLSMTATGHTLDLHTIGWTVQEGRAWCREHCKNGPPMVPRPDDPYVPKPELCVRCGKPGYEHGHGGRTDCRFFSPSDALLTAQEAAHLDNPTWGGSWEVLNELLTRGFVRKMHNTDYPMITPEGKAALAAYRASVPARTPIFVDICGVPGIAGMDALLFPTTGGPRGVILNPHDWADIRRYLRDRLNLCFTGRHGYVGRLRGPKSVSDGRSVGLWCRHEVELHEPVLVDRELDPDLPPVWSV